MSYIQVDCRTVVGPVCGSTFYFEFSVAAVTDLEYFSRLRLSTNIETKPATRVWWCRYQGHPFPPLSLRFHATAGARIGPRPGYGRGYQGVKFCRKFL
jgi:hypothetical protein